MFNLRVISLIFVVILFGECTVFAQSSLVEQSAGVQSNGYWVWSNQEYFPGQYQRREIKGEKALFLVHVSRYWDEQMLTRSTVNTFTSIFLENRAPIVTALYPSAFPNDISEIEKPFLLSSLPDHIIGNKREKFYPVQQHKTTVVPYDGDYHHIVFDVEELTVQPHNI